MYFFRIPLTEKCLCSFTEDVLFDLYSKNKHTLFKTLKISKPLGLIVGSSTFVISAFMCLNYAFHCFFLF